MLLNAMKQRRSAPVPAAASLWACACACLLLLAPSAAAASSRLLRQEVSGCTGSLVNLAIASAAGEANDLVSSGLEAAWPAIASQLNDTLGALNISIPILSKDWSIKKCGPLGKVCIGLDAALAGSVHISNGSLGGLHTPTLEVLNITCGPPIPKAPLSGSATLLTALNITADALSVHVSGNVLVTVKSLSGLSASLPVYVGGVLTLHGLRAQAKVTTDVNATASLLGGAKLTYSVAVTGFEDVALGFANVSYAPSRLPADGPTAYIVKQVEEYVSGLAMSAINSFVSKQVQTLLNKQVNQLRFQGTIKL